MAVCQLVRPSFRTGQLVEYPPGTSDAYKLHVPGITTPIRSTGRAPSHFCPAVNWSRYILGPSVNWSRSNLGVRQLVDKLHHYFSRVHTRSTGPRLGARTRQLVRTSTSFLSTGPALYFLPVNWSIYLARSGQLVDKGPLNSQFQGQIPRQLVEKRRKGDKREGKR